MRRFLALFLMACALLWSLPAAAQVLLSFHSFNGSTFAGRYPHTFIVLEGSLADGTPIAENYGFSAKSVTPAILMGPVTHEIYSEKRRYIDTTNRHFSVPLTDAQYWQIRREVDAWRDAPGKYYDLNTRNCIHFVGAIARIVGLTVDYPKGMLRKPKRWLNHIAALNPQLGAAPIR